MTKLYFLFCILFLTCLTSKSQTLKIDNSVAISSFDSEKLDMLNTSIKLYSLMFGVDYVDSNLWEVSTQLGYLRKGGKEMLDYPSLEIIEKLNYIHLNTTVRLKYEKEKYCIYLGAGPKVEFLIDNNHLKSSLYKDYKLNRISTGFKYEIGFKQYLNHRINIGLNLSYIHDIGKLGGTLYNNLINKTFLLSISLGYKLKYE